ncbi:hypothetical protein [Sulfurirhabdus autotrophica]|uniref:Dicarboxylate transport n=1 Tax=Sulfurirhabdus autotrophica TaxID=1706046 RepID=A0A4R3XSS5_9PROT|nr:hypothetical protein [Sulfurirhabdus autotrophica]TCV81296.1 hypothetical protein EDC63_12446 [Sulfurirhabdus autotrophica]
MASLIATGKWQINSTCTEQGRACSFLVHGLVLFCAFLWLQSSASAQELTLSIEDIQSPSFSASAIVAKLRGEDFSTLTVEIGELIVQGKKWKKVGLICADVRLEKRGVYCKKGMFKGKISFPVSFSYLPGEKQLSLTLNPAPREKWELFAQLRNSSWETRLSVTNGAVAQLAPWLPATTPVPSAGLISGQLSLAGKDKVPLSVSGDIQFKQLAFSDATGLHAGEKMDGRVKMQANKRGTAWKWQADLDLRNGEVFWQPLYFSKGGHSLTVKGSLNKNFFTVEQGQLKLDGIGNAELSGKWNQVDGYLNDFDLRGSGINVDGLYRILLKPYFEKTAFADLKTKGKIDLNWQFRNRATQVFDFKTHDVDIDDEKQRFALNGMNANIPWNRAQPAQANIRIKTGRVLNLPLGEMHIPLQMDGLHFALASLSIPLLDGKLNLADFEASMQNNAWRWQFSGGIAPISMEQFSNAMKIPVMQGTLSGVIPKITYADETLRMNGALLFKLFDGTVVVKNLVMLEPLGLAPRLMSDVDMRNLDLGLLTNAFSFGSIEGRIDVNVEDMVMSNWQPVRFKAKVLSSPGSYRKKISQRAVQNISALGGAGAAAAIQRSFLGIFEQFGYDKIGLSCALVNGVCVMEGVENTANGFVIVKGGGIPAITVIGYNRQVSWDELLQRLKRITQSNVKPVVQ